MDTNISITYFQEGNTIKRIVAAPNIGKNFIAIDFNRKMVTITLIEEVEVAGQVIRSAKPFEMVVSNQNEKIPVVTMSGPVMIPNPDFDPEQPESEQNPAQIRKTMGEWDMWEATLWNNPYPPFSFKKAVEDAIKRTLMRNDPSVVFDPAPPALVYVQPSNL